MPTLLHLGTPEDSSYQQLLGTCTKGTQTVWKSKLSTPFTITDLENSVSKLPTKLDGILCTNEAFLKTLLYAQADFIPPNNRRGVTLDDYQGSLLYTPRDRIPVVFANPLKNLQTVGWAQAALTRFIKKLVDPASFFIPPAFKWTIATPENLPEFFERWERLATLISIDIETPDPNPLRTINCVGYGAYFAETHTIECLVIPFASMFMLEWIRKFNKLPQPKVMQNGLYDTLYFMRFGAPVFNWLHDTQHLFHSMFSEYPKRLDFITAYAIRDIRYWKDDGKSGSITDYYRYNAKDCWATVSSYLALLLESESYAIRNYLKEFPLVFPCLAAEIEGIAVDEEKLLSVKSEIETKIKDNTTRFQTMIASGPNFNVGSWQQMAKLFTVLGCGNLGGTGKAETLKAMAAHPLNNKILSLSESIKSDRKVLTNYLVPESFYHGRLHYKLNPAGTDTGRLASSASSYWCGFQIQNIPRGKIVKQCLVSDPGYLLCEIDKAQSEARCVGYLAGETALIDLVEGPHDYHSWNAASFFGVAYEKIFDEVTHTVLDKILRELAKRTNHGANYNMGATVMLATMGPAKVAQAKAVLKLPADWTLKKVCEHLLAVYDRTYPGVRGRYYDAVIKEVNLTGRIVSPRGWTRIFFGRPSRANKPMLNAAVAHPPQNLSVDIINEEFYNVWRASVYNSYYKDGVEIHCPLRNIVRVKAQIHDSIFFQYLVSNPDTPKIVSQIMNTTVSIKGADGVTRNMYIPSDISSGKTRWSELK